MTGWTPDVSQATIIGVTMVQGVGLGFLFVPLSAATLVDVAACRAHRRRRLVQPVAQYRLERRHFGGERLLVQNTQANHAAIVPNVTRGEPGVRESR